MRLTHTNVDPRRLVYQWKPGQRKGSKKEKSTAGRSKVSSNVASQRFIITSNFPRTMKGMKNNSKSEQSIKNHQYSLKKRDYGESKKKKPKSHSNRTIRNKSILRKQSDRKKIDISSKKSIEVVIKKDNLLKSGNEIPSPKKEENHVKFQMEEFENHKLLRGNNEVLNICNKEKVQKLLKRLRIPFQDDHGIQMMKGIFSLGNFIKNIVDSTIATKNVLIAQNQFGIQEDFDEDNETLSHASYGEKDLKKAADLDMSASSNVGTAKTKSMMIINRPSKYSPAMPNTKRFLMSPVVKGIIRNNLTSRRSIQTPIEKNHHNSNLQNERMKRQLQRLNKKNSTEIKETIDESFEFQSDEDLNSNISLRDSHLDMLDPRHLTTNFMKEFMEENTHLKFVQSMKKSHRRGWEEKKTLLKYDPEHIHILIADDSYKQLETIQNILMHTNVKIDTACDGIEALEQVKTFASSGFIYHLILMDVHMPNCDGNASTINIRKFEDENNNSLKNHIVAISADEQDVTIGQTKESKMDDFIQKPISQPILFNVLKERASRLGVSELLKN